MLRLTELDRKAIRVRACSAKSIIGIKKLSNMLIRRKKTRSSHKERVSINTLLQSKFRTEYHHPYQRNSVLDAVLVLDVVAALARCRLAVAVGVVLVHRRRSRHHP